jgi:hypothetical protein
MGMVIANDALAVIALVVTVAGMWWAINNVRDD